MKKKSITNVLKTNKPFFHKQRRTYKWISRYYINIFLHLNAISSYTLWHKKKQFLTDTKKKNEK